MVGRFPLEMVRRIANIVMKRLTTIMCAVLLMAIGFWRAWSDVNSVRLNPYKTIAASDVPVMVPSMQMMPQNTLKDSVEYNNNVDAVSHVEVPVEHIPEPVMTTMTNKKRKNKPVTKVSSSNQKRVAPKKAEAEAIKVSNDSATYYGKRILDVVEHLDKKISAPCVEIHEDADTLSNGSH